MSFEKCQDGHNGGQDTAKPDLEHCSKELNTMLCQGGVQSLGRHLVHTTKYICVLSLDKKLDLTLIVT